MARNIDDYIAGMTEVYGRIGRLIESEKSPDFHRLSLDDKLKTKHMNMVLGDLMVAIDKKIEQLHTEGLQSTAPEPVKSGAFDYLMTEFPIGTLVTKKSGSSWTGKVCGYYASTRTPYGLAVESIFEPGSVQIYPALALTQRAGMSAVEHAWLTLIETAKAAMSTLKPNTTETNNG